MTEREKVEREKIVSREVPRWVHSSPREELPPWESATRVHSLSHRKRKGERGANMKWSMKGRRSRTNIQLMGKIVDRTAERTQVAGNGLKNDNKWPER
jgi:hypothetical protein